MSHRRSASDAMVALRSGRGGTLARRLAFVCSSQRAKAVARSACASDATRAASSAVGCLSGSCGTCSHLQVAMASERMQSSLHASVSVQNRLCGSNMVGRTLACASDATCAAGSCGTCKHEIRNGWSERISTSHTAQTALQRLREPSPVAWTPSAVPATPASSPRAFCSTSPKQQLQQ